MQQSTLVFKILQTYHVPQLNTCLSVKISSAKLHCALMNGIKQLVLFD